MSEPKRGKHHETCIFVHPNCRCVTCQNDRSYPGCCNKSRKLGYCEVTVCTDYIKDEPTKKGAADV